MHDSPGEREHSGSPDPAEMVRDLQRALYGADYATAHSPAEEWQRLLSAVAPSQERLASLLYVLFSHWVKPETIGCSPWTPEDWRTQANSLLRRIGEPTDSGEAS